MKRLLIIFAILIAAVPIFAQDETDEPPCEVDFSAVIAQLENAQTTFSDGYDVDALRSSILEAEDMLNDISDTCRLAALGPDLPLDEEYAISADGVSVTFNYPTEWTLDDQEFLVVVGTSQEAIDAFQDNDPIFQPEDFGIGMIVSGVNELIDEPVADVYELARQLTQDINIDAEIGPEQYYSVNDRPAVQIDLITEDYTIYLIVVDYGQDRYVVYIAAGQSNTAEAYLPTLLNIINSLRYEDAD